MASIQPAAPITPTNITPTNTTHPNTAPTKSALSQPAREQSQEAMPELGVFADDDLNNSLDPGHSEALGEGSLLDE